MERRSQLYVAGIQAAIRHHIVVPAENSGHSLLTHLPVCP
jgi:hypothetical protein